MFIDFIKSARTNYKGAKFLVAMSIVNKATTIQTAEPNKIIGQRSENMEPKAPLNLNQMLTPQWNLSQIIGKKRHLTTIDITASTTGIIFNFQNSMYNVLQLFDTPYLPNMFGFAKFDVVFDLEIQSHFQHQGSLIANIYPFVTKGDGRYALSQHGLSYTLLSNPDNYTKVLFPHDFITLGHNGNYRVVLPWASNRKMLPIKSTSDFSDNFGALFKFVMNAFELSIFAPLQHVSSAVGTSSIRIWANLENLQYSGYYPQY